jgi:hypothetical protein
MLQKLPPFNAVHCQEAFAEFVTAVHATLLAGPRQAAHQTPKHQVLPNVSITHVWFAVLFVSTGSCLARHPQVPEVNNSAR